MNPRRRVASLLLSAAMAVAYWDGKGRDPFTEAMEMKRRVQNDPSLLAKDPDFFKRVFGQLAKEQSQAVDMDQTQNVAPHDLCMACHGVVVEVEKALCLTCSSVARESETYLIT